jgi:enterochelin esterase family protein
VLYLYHGGGGLEADWSRDGRTGVILDNLIAAGRALPMIVVMPNNTVVGQGGGPPAGRRSAGPPASAATLGRELLTDIIPFVERQYRVQADRDHRAIAGLSAGGGTSFTVGMNNLSTFATVAEFSSGMFGGSGAAGPDPSVAVSPDTIVPGILQNGADMSRQLKLFYMSCGLDDPRLPFQTLTRASLEKAGFAPVFMTFAGAHQWKVWRHSLHDLAPRLFR